VSDTDDGRDPGDSSQRTVMTKDYRRNPTPKRRRDARRGSCAFWFLFGGLIGAFGVGYAWMIHEPGADQLNEQATTRPPPKPPQERTFDFYSLLPEEEVVVPPQEPAEPTALPPSAATAPQQAPPVQNSAPQARDQRLPQPTPTSAETAPTSKTAPGSAQDSAPGGSGDYLLQVGSFRSSSDAERLKAQLALKDIPTRIQTVTIDNGQTYHRVRTGTYDKTQAQSLSAKLAREGQESIMIRAR
jgi:cell division protein FtsN